MDADHPGRHASEAECVNGVEDAVVSLDDLFPSGITTWQIALAILSVVVGWVTSHFARGAVLKLAARTPGISDSVAQLAARVTQYTLLLVGIGIGLAFLGANVQPLLAMTAIAVVVLILVLRGVADNFAAGVLIQSRQSVKIGEQICVEGPDGAIRGVVRELTGRTVIITTADGRTAHVPNALLLTGVLLNESRHGARRSTLEIRAARAEGRELQSLIEVVLDAAAEIDGVHRNEHAQVLATSVSPTRWILSLQLWHHPLHGAAVVSDAVQQVAAALEAAGITAVVVADRGENPLVVAEQI